MFSKILVKYLQKPIGTLRILDFIYNYEYDKARSEENWDLEIQNIKPIFKKIKKGI
jgi:hypothetical protein